MAKGETACDHSLTPTAGYSRQTPPASKHMGANSATHNQYLIKMTACKKIVGISMVKNEQDIIEPFVRHSVKICDFLFIIDHNSSDETRKILRQCSIEFPTLVVFDNKSFLYRQSEIITETLQRTQDIIGADFVMFLDADEFISAPDRACIESILDTIPHGGIGYVPWRTFVLGPDDVEIAAADPPGRFSRRRTTEMPPTYKAILRLDGMPAHDLEVTQGNHDILRRGLALPSVQLQELYLHHFPVRSRDQLTAKAIIGWTANVAGNPLARPQGLAWQWREAFDQIVAGGRMVTNDELALASFTYQQTRCTDSWLSQTEPDTPPRGYARKYSDGRFSNALSLIARSWEQSVVAPIATEDRARALSNSLNDEQSFRFIAERHRPSSVLALGGHSADYLDLFEALGAGRLCACPMGKPGETLPDDAMFDLVLCLSAPRRPDQPSSAALLDAISRHGLNRLVISIAEPRWPPWAAIGAARHRQWLGSLAARGWAPHLIDSLAMRCLAIDPALRRSLVVLTRGEAQGGTIDALIASSARAPHRRFQRRASWKDALASAQRSRLGGTLQRAARIRALFGSF